MKLTKETKDNLFFIGRSTWQLGEINYPKPLFLPIKEKTQLEISGGSKIPQMVEGNARPLDEC